MVLYRKMLAQDMVSAPFVAKADLGVTGDAKEMRIDDRILRITAHSQLQTDSSKWQPISPIRSRICNFRFGNTLILILAAAGTIRLPLRPHQV